MSTIEHVVSGYKLTVAQQHWVLTNMRAAAERVHRPVVVAAIDATMPAVLAALKVEEGYAAARGRQADSQDARVLDQQIMRIIGSLHRILASMAHLGREHAGGRAASDLLTEAFPLGLRGHVNRSFTDKVVLTDRLVQRLRDPEALTPIASHPIPILVDQIEALHRRFVAQISFAPEVTFDEVAAARALGNASVQRAVCAVIALLPVDDVAAQDAIIDPWMEMQRRIGAEKRARLGRTLTVVVDPLSPAARGVAPTPRPPAEPLAVVEDAAAK